MAAFEFDLFVIGGGSGGVRAARMAAASWCLHGENGGAQGLGGTCVNVGCIPKKLYSYAAHFAESVEESRGFGWEGDALCTLNWATLKENRRREIARLNGIYLKLLVDSGVKVINGHARLMDAHTVEAQVVEGGLARPQRFSAKNILVATGGTPFVPHIAGHEHVLTSNDMFDIDPFPNRLLVVGGGYIACEFASSLMNWVPGLPSCIAVSRF